MPFDASADAAQQFEAEMQARPSVNILCPSRPSNSRVAKYSWSNFAPFNPSINTGTGGGGLEG